MRYRNGCFISHCLKFKKKSDVTVSDVKECVVSVVFLVNSAAVVHSCSKNSCYSLSCKYK